MLSTCARIALRTCVAFAALVVAVWCLSGLSFAGTDSAFYRANPEQLPGLPGTLINVETMPGAPLGAQAYRILYRSRGLNDEPIAVSGVVVVPAGDAPAGGRPVVAWAHPTTGVVSRCAPSLDRFVFQTMIGLRAFIASGDIVVATDYPGLGTPGPHPYLIGTSEGRAVLDAVRAARDLPGSGAGDAYVVWGHSQGGHAAIYAAEMASRYAPELRLRGVALAAPATDLLTLIQRNVDTDGGRNLTAMTLWSWSQVFGLPLQPVVLPIAVPDVDRLAGECLESIGDFIVRRHVAAPLKERFLGVPDITRARPWRAILDANVAGLPPPDVPVFVVQGDADRLVLPEVTQVYVERLCRAGNAVQSLRLQGVNHGFVAYKSQAAAVRWIGDRFEGRAAPDDCARGAATASLCMPSRTSSPGSAPAACRTS